NDVQALRDHLARFPGGTTEQDVRAKLDQLVWTALGSAQDIKSHGDGPDWAKAKDASEKTDNAENVVTLTQLRSYLDEFPNGANSAQAHARIAALEKEAAERRTREQLQAQQTADWAAVAASSKRGELEAFLKKWPFGSHSYAARERIAELRRGVVRRVL